MPWLTAGSGVVPSAIAMSICALGDERDEVGVAPVLERHVEARLAVVAGLVGEVELGELDARDVAQAHGQLDRRLGGEAAAVDGSPPGAGADRRRDDRRRGRRPPLEQAAATSAITSDSRARERIGFGFTGSSTPDDIHTASGRPEMGPRARSRADPASFHPDCHRRLRPGDGSRARRRRICWHPVVAIASPGPLVGSPRSRVASARPSHRRESHLPRRPPRS